MKTPKHGIERIAGIELDINSEVKTNWPKFAECVLKTAAHGFAAAHGSVGQVTGVVGSVIELGTTTSTNPSPGHSGWSLFALSFAWAFDELRARGDQENPAAKEAVRNALKMAKESVENGNQFIPLSFLDQPITLPLYKSVRDAFIVHKSGFRLTATESDESIKAKFDSAFSCAVFLLWSQKPIEYEIIKTALTAPGSKAHAHNLVPPVVDLSANI